jgi:hypothetical protein
MQAKAMRTGLIVTMEKWESVNPAATSGSQRFIKLGKTMVIHE